MKVMLRILTSSPGRSTWSENRSRKACSVVTRAAVSTSCSQPRSSITTVRGTSPALYIAISPAAESPSSATVSPATRICGNAPPRQSSATSPPASSVRTRYSPGASASGTSRLSPGGSAHCVLMCGVTPGPERQKKPYSTGRTAGLGLKQSSTLLAKSHSKSMLQASQCTPLGSSLMLLADDLLTRQRGHRMSQRDSSRPARTACRNSSTTSCSGRRQRRAIASGRIDHRSISWVSLMCSSSVAPRPCS